MKNTNNLAENIRTLSPLERTGLNRKLSRRRKDRSNLTNIEQSRAEKSVTEEEIIE